MKTITINLAPEIEELCKNLREQDERITNLSVYCVQSEERIYGFDDGYSDNYIWLCCGEEVHDDDLIAELDKKAENWENTTGYSKVYYKDHWVTKQSFLTEVAAQRYIDCNGHNLGGRENCRVYVESGYRNSEWETVREFFMKLDITNS